MKKFFQNEILTVGLAIFSMFFGAGNLMYPIKAGMESGSQFYIGMFAFLITSIVLPLLGLISMILFEGDYKKFALRLGNTSGYILLTICMLILGPIIAMPRIVTLSYTMMLPFIPGISLFVFAILFLGITYLCTYRENQIVDLLGKFISPALVVSLLIIIIKGFIIKGNAAQTSLPALDVFKQNFWRGYHTLDLLAAIFFSSIILHILKINYKNETNKKLAYLGLQAGVIGLVLLSLIYVGLGFLGLYHGSGFENINPGELFREVSFKVLGAYGAVVISVAVLMACLSTAIALSAVVAEYLQLEVLKGKIGFSKALAVVLLSCIPLSIYGLDTILSLTGGPITYIGYPILITLTIVNIAYKTVGFRYVKLPVFTVGILAAISYYFF